MMDWVGIGGHDYVAQLHFGMSWSNEVLDYYMAQLHFGMSLREALQWLFF